MLSKEEKIIVCAEKLFAEKGFEGTTTREISKAAGMNISMISYYFGSKEKLYEGIFQYRMGQSLEFLELVIARRDLNAWEKTEMMITQYITRVQKFKEFYLILYREQISSRKNPIINDHITSTKRLFLQAYQTIIEEGYQEKIFKNQIQIEFLQATVTGTLMFAMNSFEFYKNIFQKKGAYKAEYNRKLTIYLRNLLKNVLGYEENV